MFCMVLLVGASSAAFAGGSSENGPTGVVSDGVPLRIDRTWSGLQGGVRVDMRQRDPYVGLVADGTVTFIGQEFYRAFMNTWLELGMTDRYSLSIHERPSARWGSMVWVEFANRRVFSTFLSPGLRASIAETGEQAARQAHQNVVDVDLQRLLFKDPDLAADEF